MASIESISWSRAANPRISMVRIAFLSANVALWTAVFMGFKLALG